MTERVDVFTLAGKTFDLQVMGAFEVKDEKINGWRLFRPKPVHQSDPKRLSPCENEGRHRENTSRDPSGAVYRARPVGDLSASDD
jgi:hypothetical protein